MSVSNNNREGVSVASRADENKHTESNLLVTANTVTGGASAVSGSNPSASSGPKYGPKPKKSHSQGSSRQARDGGPGGKGKSSASGSSRAKKYRESSAPSAVLGSFVESNSKLEGDLFSLRKRLSEANEKILDLEKKKSEKDAAKVREQLHVQHRRDLANRFRFAYVEETSSKIITTQGLLFSFLLMPLFAFYIITTTWFTGIFSSVTLSGIVSFFLSWIFWEKKKYYWYFTAKPEDIGFEGHDCRFDNLSFNDLKHEDPIRCKVTCVKRDQRGIYYTHVKPGASQLETMVLTIRMWREVILYHYSVIMKLVGLIDTARDSLNFDNELNFLDEVMKNSASPHCGENRRAIYHTFVVSLQLFMQLSNPTVMDSSIDSKIIAERIRRQCNTNQTVNVQYFDVLSGSFMHNDTAVVLGHFYRFMCWKTPSQVFQTSPSS